MEGEGERVWVANVRMVVVPPAMAEREPVSKLSAHWPPSPWGPRGGGVGGKGRGSRCGRGVGSGRDLEHVKVNSDMASIHS